jgi:hypothetical protein
MPFDLIFARNEKNTNNSQYFVEKFVAFLQLNEITVFTRSIVRV